MMVEEFTLSFHEGCNKRNQYFASSFLNGHGEPTWRGDEKLRMNG
jgi:hypothetical protein